MILETFISEENSLKIAPDCRHDCDSLALNHTSSVQISARFNE